MSFAAFFELCHAVMDADRRAEEDRQRAGAPPQQAFFVGDQVQEREFGFSSPATVTRVNNNGTYDVQCNDGATKHFMAPADLEAVRQEGGARSPKSRKRRVSWCDESGVADLATVFDGSDRLTDKRASVVDTMSMHMNRKTEATFAVEDRVRVRTEEGMVVGRIDAIDNTGAGAYQVMLLDGEGVDTGVSIRVAPDAMRLVRPSPHDAGSAARRTTPPAAAALPPESQQLFRALSARRGQQDNSVPREATEALQGLGEADPEPAVVDVAMLPADTQRLFRALSARRDGGAAADELRSEKDEVASPDTAAGAAAGTTVAADTARAVLCRTP